MNDDVEQIRPEDYIKLLEDSLLVRLEDRLVERLTDKVVDSVVDKLTAHIDKKLHSISSDNKAIQLTLIDQGLCLGRMYSIVRRCALCPSIPEAGDGENSIGGCSDRQI